MKCWFCDKEAKGTCAACGRGLCADHAHFYASFYAKRIPLLAEEGKRPWIAGESLSPVVPAFPPASVFLLLVDRNVP